MMPGVRGAMLEPVPIPADMGTTGSDRIGSAAYQIKRRCDDAGPHTAATYGVAVIQGDPSRLK